MGKDMAILEEENDDQQEVFNVMLQEDGSPS